MFIVGSYTLAVVFCFVTMLCWGSWGNTQKLAAKSWRYELFYWDYVIGMVLFSLLLAFTAGSIGTEGRPFLQDIAQADWASIGWVLLGAVVFNVSNILLSASTSIAGMAVAFPLGVGIALVMGVLNNLLLHPVAGQNTTLLWLGVALVVAAVICNGVASGKVSNEQRDPSRTARASPWPSVPVLSCPSSPPWYIMGWTWTTLLLQPPGRSLLTRQWSFSPWVCS